MKAATRILKKLVHVRASRNVWIVQLSVLQLLLGLILGGATSAADASTPTGLNEGTSVDSKSTQSALTEHVETGVKYRLITTGTYRAGFATDGAPLMADAECVNGKRRTALSTYDDLYDLYVAGQPVEWTATKPADAIDGCAADEAHTYFLDFIAQQSGEVELKVRDDNLADNLGVLTARLACQVSWPGGVYIQPAAINDAANETATASQGCQNGQVYEPESFKRNQTENSAKVGNYSCGKNERRDIVDAGETFGALQTANVIVDSRENFYDPVNPGDQWAENRGYSDNSGGYYDMSQQDGHYKQTGHWGIQTCHWAAAGKTYRITVSGTYKFDQSQPDGFAMADAECATGYKPSNSVRFDHNGLTSDPWPEKHVPDYYQYFFEGKGDGVGTFDQYGSEWKAHRFDYTSKTIVGQDAFRVDGSDLELGWQGEASFVKWTALDRDASGNLLPIDADCSPIHTYALDWTGSGRQLHFVIWDNVRYNEWDNCGLLSIRVTEDLTEFEEPSAAPSVNCNWVPVPQARAIGIRDTKTVGGTATGTGIDAHPYYFDPPNRIVKTSLFNAQTGNVDDMVVIWQNNGAGPHSVTAQVDVDGNFCEDLIVGGEITTDPLGRDDCDREGRQRIFDSNPYCPLDVCMAPLSWFTWRPELPESAKAKLCDDGFCTIPYFCRVKGDLMRGTIIFSQP